jgi:hypothetical protein
MNKSLVSPEQAWALVGGVGFGISFHQFLGGWAWVLFLAPVSLAFAKQTVGWLNADGGDSSHNQE